MMSAVSGDGGEHRLAKVLATLPSTNVQCDMAEVYQIVHAARLPNAHKLVAVQAHAKHRLIMKALALLCDGVFRSGMLANCRVGDKVLVGVSALRVYAMENVQGNTATNKDCELLQVVRLSSCSRSSIMTCATSSPLRQEVCETRECRLAVVALEFFQIQERARGGSRHVRASADGQKLVF